MVVVEGGGFEKCEEVVGDELSIVRLCINEKNIVKFQVQFVLFYGMVYYFCFGCGERRF